MTLLNLDLKSTIIDTYYIWFSSRTMCDFHDLVSLNNVKSVFWVVALLPQRLKSTLFEIFFLTPLAPWGRSVQKNLKQR